LPLLFTFADFVTDNTTNRCAADRSKSASTGKGGTADSANASAYRSVPIPR
jgi:hypothetical protein